MQNGWQSEKIDVIGSIARNSKGQFQPASRSELDTLLLYRYPLGDIDVSKIKNMSYLFHNTRIRDFSGIETWDVSAVQHMDFMFGSDRPNEGVNPDISGWNTKSLENMRGMMARCQSFNRDLSGWDVSNVLNADYAFAGCRDFDQDLSGWDLSRIGVWVDGIFFDCPKMKPELYRSAKLPEYSRPEHLFAGSYEAVFRLVYSTGYLDVEIFERNEARVERKAAMAEFASLFADDDELRCIDDDDDDDDCD